MSIRDGNIKISGLSHGKFQACTSWSDVISRVRWAWIPFARAHEKLH